MNEIESNYLQAHARALKAIRDLEQRIMDMPAPGGEAKIDWGHVGDLNNIVKCIEEIASC